MIRTLFTLLPLACCFFPGGDPEQRSKPNILLLLADDQRTDTIGAWGNPMIQTPALDRLVERGFSLERTYCLGSPHGAVCVPSRAMLHTGQAYFGMNLSTFDGRPTLGQLLGEKGYETFATGKWHNGQETFARSFDKGRDVMFGGMSDHHAVPLVDYDGDEFSEIQTGPEHSSTLFADQAVAFLQRQAQQRRSGRKRPFFLYVGFQAPHDPRDPPPAYRELYRDPLPPLPKNFRGQHGFRTGFLTVRDEQLAAWPREQRVIREQLAEYWGLVTHLDHEVGRILEALAQNNFEKDTVVVYAADHGLALGSHGLLGKQNLYEHSIRTPLVLAGPGIRHGQSSALVYLHDLFPTLLGVARIEPPASESARDLMPLVRGRAEALRPTLFFSMGRTQRAVSDGRWKLVRYPAIDHTQLFDLGRDPDELQDLAARPENAARVTELRAKLEDWQKQLGDDVPWTEPEPEPGAIDLTGHAREPDSWQPAWIREKYFGE